jgi:hypothetical protein
LNTIDSSFFPFFLPRRVVSAIAGLEEAKNLAGKVLRLIQIGLSTPSLAKTTPACQANSPHAQIADSSSKNRRQLFIRSHNETLSVAAMRVSNPDGSPVRIKG